MSEHLELTVDQGLATIRFNRPDAMNAFTLRMIADLTDMVRDLAEDADCRVVVLRHAGANLCAGADAAELADSAGQTPSERGRAFYHGLATRIQPLLRAFRALPQPILVGAGGHAIGLGVQFLLVADLIVRPRWQFADDHLRPVDRRRVGKEPVAGAGKVRRRPRLERNLAHQP